MTPQPNISAKGRADAGALAWPPPGLPMARRLRGEQASAIVETAMSIMLLLMVVFDVMAVGFAVYT